MRAPVCDAWTLRLVAETTDHLEVRQGVVEPSLIGCSLGAMITVVEGAGSGYAATSDLSPSGLRAAAIAALVCLATFAFVYSLSLAPNFDWHLRTSAARLLWVPSLPILASFCTALSKSRPTPNELRAERTATAAADTTCRTFFDPCGRMAAPASANASFAWNPGAWARQAH